MVLDGSTIKPAGAKNPEKPESLSTLSLAKRVISIENGEDVPTSPCKRINVNQAVSAAFGSVGDEVGVTRDGVLSDKIAIYNFNVPSSLLV